MDSPVLQFVINIIFPWLVFSNLAYACTSYITKNNNTSPNLWWLALVTSFLPFTPAYFGSISLIIPNLEYLNSGIESVQIIKQASITQASLNKADLITTVLFVCYLGYTLFKLYQLAITWQNLKRITDSSELIHDLRTNKISTMVSPINHSPFVFGMAHPHIVLPKYFLSLEKYQQNILIQHELTHIANKDHIAILLWRVFSNILWVNPIIKKMEWQFVRAMEHRCDKSTIRRFNINKHDYANTLLASLKRSTQLDYNNPVAQFNSGALCTEDYRVRLTNIIHPVGKPPFFLAIKFILAVLILYFLSTFFKEATTSSTPGWQNPLETFTITSRFHSVTKIRNYKVHQGIDYTSYKGSSVLSAADGVVVVADGSTLNSNYGNTVLIQHKGGYQTLYAHLNSINVDVGSWVKTGQSIGIIGETGKATDVHLHFEVIKDNKRTDPSLIFN